MERRSEHGDDDRRCWDELLAELERRRDDPEFRERLERLIEEDREVLDRLSR